ncbi:MAG: STAS domain-containing protein [Elainellaceae cyanobacterium]
MKQKTLEIDRDKQVSIFRPSGRLDITTAWQFRLTLQECISPECPHAIINLNDVSFVDSSGLTSLVAGMRDADKVNGSFQICNVHSDAKLVLEVTMMDSVFEIVASEQDALDAISD